MAKRSPPASTISAETIASVSGILIVNVVPAPGSGFQIDRTADLLHVGAHDVHPNAAPRDAGDLCCGREAGREDQITDLRLGFRRDLRFAGEALLDGLRAYPLNVKATAIIGDLDDDMAALVTSGEPDRPLPRLTCGDALRGALDAVIGAVAHQMGERVLDHLQHLAVELGVGAAHFEIDLFAKLGGQVAHDARQLLPRIADRCMRVFITPSCSSAVTLERRCNRTLKSKSSWRRTISRSWLRVRTSSETVVIR